MFKTTLTAALVAAGALALAGCDVKKTTEGKYEVTPPDVKVGKTEKQVTVPKTVETEKRTIEVPKVDVKTAKEKEQEQAQKQMGASGTGTTR
jgi:ABC-type uncharacterized transport system auxiliary subunit